MKLINLRNHRRRSRPSSRLVRTLGVLGVGAISTLGLLTANPAAAHAAEINQYSTLVRLRTGSTSP